MASDLEVTTYITDERPDRAVVAILKIQAAHRFLAEPLRDIGTAVEAFDDPNNPVHAVWCLQRKATV